MMSNNVCTYCGDTLITGLNGDVCLECLYEEHHEVYAKEEEEAKHNLKHALANHLQALKGFEVGYTSNTNNAIVVEHNDEVFILRFELTPYTLEGAVDEL